MFAFAALTNGKNVLPQICNRLQCREFALDVAVELDGLNEATKRAVAGLPAADVPRNVIEGAELSCRCPRGSFAVQPCLGPAL